MPSNTTYGLHIPLGTDAANTAIKDPTNANALDASAGHVWEVNARSSTEQTVLTCNVVSATATGGQFAATGPAMALYMTTAGVLSLYVTPSGSSGGVITWGPPVFFVSMTNASTSPSAVLSASVVSASTYQGLPQLSIVPTPQILAPGSGTYVTPAGARSLWVRCIGGGGGGGAGGNSGSNLSSAGGGGGAGGYVEAWITTPAATYVYTVGTGGAAGTSGVNGVAGNPSSFGTNISAGGGSGGVSIGNGNAGGTGGVVTLTGLTGTSIIGNPGGAGSVAISVGGSNDQIAGPTGGASVFGGAGVGGDANNGNGRAGQANSGSGGGGGTGISNGGSGGIGIGGAGGSGTIFVVAF